MTRWHSDDIAGRLLQQDGWKVLRLPALAELPDPMNRAAGEALWPEWEDREALIAKQTTLGDRCFAALFQQAPLADSGRLFDLSKIRLLDIVPVGTSVRAWDLAGVGGQGGDPDWTAGVKLSQSEQGSFVVEDVRRVRLPATEVAALIRDVAEQDGETVAIGLPRDPGQAGIYQVAMLTRMLAGFRVQSTPEEGPKIVRADPVASQVSAGNLYVRRATWNQIFLEELAAFPHGKKDDQVDALSRAFRMLTVRPQAAHFRSLPFLDR
jgi:predicted phage terminase large subunit-like protein